MIFPILNKLFDRRHKMAAPTTAQMLGNLTGEYIGKLGNAYNYVEDAVVGKFNSYTAEYTKDDTSKVKVFLDWFTPERKEWIAKIIFGLAILYNFKEDKLAFLTGATVGFFSSMGRAPEWLSFDTLQQKEIFSMKAEDGWKIQKVMLLIAFLNWSVGETRVDNFFFGGLSGLISGNCLYHAAKANIDEKMKNFLQTQVGQYAKAIYDGAAERADKAFNALLGPGEV